MIPRVGSPGPARSSLGTLPRGVFPFRHLCTRGEPPLRRKLIGSTKAAALIGVTTRSLRRLIYQGRLKPVGKIGQFWRYDPAAVLALVTPHPTKETETNQ